MATTRRTFLKTAVWLAGASALGFSARKAKPRLAFSTLGCPTWPLSKIVKTAVDERYEAVEIRGLEKEMYLPKRPEFSTAIAETRRLFADNNLKLCNLGASSNLHYMDATRRQKNMDEARRFIDLAGQLTCPYVRVFPNDLPKDQDRQQTIDLISANLLDLGQYAKGANVTVLLESHGEVVWKDLLVQIMQKAEHPNVGLIWDIFNMWSITKEPPAEVYQTLKKYIRHTHIKDGSMVAGKPAYTFIGKGEAPLKEAIDALKAGGYSGYYSFEWEKMWHPEIPEPELAFADYPKAIQSYF
ncbi:sugar phosphate isomerase/epimerase family protein [Spirosoma panaciterrae]|uniref:sugar phosphate isomerase/epimerase family protein n=1 Tax=Spirosoma panaciterrae TaxID=496058 RepID=UPI00035D13C7|nr:sugar phosphate isomerase/epimerase family protein [Spirosoma panaciterrae]